MWQSVGCIQFKFFVLSVLYFIDAYHDNKNIITHIKYTDKIKYHFTANDPTSSIGSIVFQNNEKWGNFLIFFSLYMYTNILKF